MKFFKSLFACFSTYSRIPMPVINLDSDDMKYSLAFFPLIGVVIGLFQYGFYSICMHWNIPQIVFALIATCIPILVTGGIHVDGYMDTMDVFNSYGDREKKLMIMKDPHTGAFAVIYLVLYCLLYTAFIYMINAKSIILFCTSFVISRICSGLSVLTIKSAKSEGMLQSLKKNSSEKVVLTILIIFAVISEALIVVYSPIVGAAMGIVAVALFILYRYKCLKELGGVTGDTSGCFLCIMELILLMISAIGGIL